MKPFTPSGLRPVGVFPAAPRVIYKTERKNLSHEGRIGRIDRLDTLEPFRVFSREFHSFHPRLAPELNGYLHNRGFLPDKGALFGLPSDEVDAYLSDFQATILPLVNGRYGAAGDNRLLLWQLHSRVLPLASLVSARRDGRIIKFDTEQRAKGEHFLSRPRFCHLGAVAEISAKDPTAAGEDRIFFRLAPGLKAGKVVRIAVLHDPIGNAPKLLAASLIEGSPDKIDLPGEAVVYRRVEPLTGALGTRRRFVRGQAQASEQLRGGVAAVPEWPALMAEVLAGLRRLPVWAAIQIDVLVTPKRFQIIDMTNLFDVAGLQLDGPIMGSDLAVRFLKRYGL